MKKALIGIGMIILGFLILLEGLYEIFANVIILTLYLIPNINKLFIYCFSIPYSIYTIYCVFLCMRYRKIVIKERKYKIISIIYLVTTLIQSFANILNGGLISYQIPHNILSILFYLMVIYMIKHKDLFEKKEST